MLVYDVNAYLIADSTLHTLCGETPNIQPISGARNTDAPYILYFFYPHLKSQEQYYWRRDIIKYEVWDTDLSRAINIGERIIALINKGDSIQHAFTTSNIPKSAFLTRGEVNPSSIRDGWYNYTLIFVIEYL